MRLRNRNYYIDYYTIGWTVQDILLKHKEHDYQFTNFKNVDTFTNDYDPDIHNQDFLFAIVNDFMATPILMNAVSDSKNKRWFTKIIYGADNLMSVIKYAEYLKKTNTEDYEHFLNRTVAFSYAQYRHFEDAPDTGEIPDELLETVIKSFNA